jgi:hypothetical protein
MTGMLLPILTLLLVAFASLCIFIALDHQRRVREWSARGSHPQVADVVSYGQPEAAGPFLARSKS